MVILYHQRIRNSNSYPSFWGNLGVLQVSAPVYAIPQVDDPLALVVEGMYRVGGENAMCGLFCLGKLFYMYDAGLDFLVIDSMVGQFSCTCACQ